MEIDVRGGGESDRSQAEISRISPFLEAESFSTTAEIDVPGAGPACGRACSSRCGCSTARSERATLVPASALWEDPRTGDWTVFVVEDGDGLIEPDSPGGEIPDDSARRYPGGPSSVLAEGRGRVGGRGVDEGEWVVTLGQHLLQESLDAAGGQALRRPGSGRPVGPRPGAREPAARGPARALPRQAAAGGASPRRRAPGEPGRGRRGASRGAGEPAGPTAGTER